MVCSAADVAAAAAVLQEAAPVEAPAAEETAPAAEPEKVRNTAHTAVHAILQA
jgi:hypothetical protein